MASVRITAVRDGPYHVQGDVELFYEGAPVRIKPGVTTVLCRCGASSNKPFCDGTHTKIGFRAAARAVPESRE